MRFSHIFFLEEKPNVIEEEEIETRKSKRKIETEDALKKKLLRAVSEGANKENIKNIENRLERRIEALLEEKLKKSLLRYEISTKFRINIKVLISVTTKYWMVLHKLDWRD